MKKIMLQIVMVIIGLSCILTSFSANDIVNQLKIGIVDVTEILQQSPQIIAIKDKLKRQFQPRFNQLNKDKENLTLLVKKLKKDGITMQSRQRKALQQKINEDEKKLIIEQQKLQLDFQKARQQYIPIKMLLNNLHKAINNVAKNGDYTLVLPKNMAAYYKEGDFLKDITPQVHVAFEKIKLDTNGLTSSPSHLKNDMNMTSPKESSHQ